MELTGKFAGRATAAADEIMRKFDLDDEESHGDAVAGAPDVLATHDLLSFGFTDPDQTGARPGDMEKACSVMSALAERSGTLATIYMVSGLLGPLCVSYMRTTDQKSALSPATATPRAGSHSMACS